MAAIADRNDSHAFREQVRALAMQIGLRPAARALGLNEDTVCKWSERGKWMISLINPPLSQDARLSANVSNPINVLASIMAQEGDRTRSAMARTARRAFEHCDTLSDAELHDMQRAIALEKHGKNAGLAHNWNQQQNNVAVQVNVPLPDETERKQMSELDAKLDAIAAKLKGIGSRTS